ncbi:MAG: prephenate dehydrogenase/arogenate dehydrogenase family protein [Acidobacteria bacterium]|nr:prephenate dehydrogenase/arogenate dehydrogenase family protein [Acidobacteriota bacterium]
MIIVMEESANEAQVVKVIERIVELGFDIYRTTGARYTILGAVGNRPIEPSDVQAMERLDGVKDVVRISGDSVRKIQRPLAVRPPETPAVHFPHLTIFGVGLIGGSLALAAREAGLAARISGCGDKKFLEAALALQVIDDIDEAFENGETSDADLIYLAAPVNAIVEFLQTKSHLVKAGAIITDAGSAKREICQAARDSLPATVAFVGGHPMAGSHRVGVEFASADLFKRAAYALIVDATNQPDRVALANIEALIKTIGGRVVQMSAEQHDQIAARLSHAPQLVSTALVNAVAKSNASQALALAGRGFQDMTRLANSRWSVWEDIIEANADEIVLALTEVIFELQKVRDSIAHKDLSDLRKAFAAANDYLHNAP